jgi:group II intron reverse transcriptase/maturase
LPVRERMIPKPGGKLRRLGIPTVADRVAQASLKLVLEPIWEADVHPCSYGFRPQRRALDAIEEIRMLAGKTYERVFEGDIAACFDSISHPALMTRMPRRIGDRRVLGLVKAFLKAGVLSEAGANRETITGTPQGGILSPLLANIACRSSMSISPRSGGGTAPPSPSGSAADDGAWRTTGWSGTPTTSWSWSAAPANRPKACGTRWRRSSPPSG